MAATLLAILGLAACGPAGDGDQAGNRDAATAPAAASVDGARLLAADTEPGQWMSYGRTYAEQRYSPLKEIDAGNVGQLGLAWYADLGTGRGHEATPIVVDGVIYVTTSWSKVFAFDARTGRRLWAFDPQVPGEYAVNSCCDVVNRGVAVWQGKVYVGTIDARLIALDAATGKELWSAQTAGAPYSITGAPRVAGGLVLIGNGGAEFTIRGYVSAYDAETGELVWRFYTVPGDPAKGFENDAMAMAAKTWTGTWWKTGGGGSTWDSIIYDPDTGLVLFGVGNGSPWQSSERTPGKGGDNLFLTSIVAVDLKTGSYRWHFQQTPSDSWDYDSNAPLMLADLRIGGETRHVVMQANKNGFFYVLDAATGEFISGKNFVPVNWTTGLDPETGRADVVPAARYDITGKGFIVRPGPEGAHSWAPTSFSPQTGLVYIPAVDTNYAFLFNDPDEDAPTGPPRDLFAEQGVERISNGFLVAWDPVRQSEVWRVDFGTGRGGGTLVTAGGLVFQGNSNEEFVAYRADTGERLWSAPAQTRIVAAPVTYTLDGAQYVAVLAGVSRNYYDPTYSRLLVYKLGGTVQLPPKAPPPPAPVLDPPPATASADVVAHGRQVYDQLCGGCHSARFGARGVFPNLHYSSALESQEDFDAIVLDGIRQDKGMVSFASKIGADDAAAIRAFIIADANRAKAAAQAASLVPAPGKAEQRNEHGQ